VKNIVTIALFIAIVIFILTGHPRLILYNSAWIRNDMKTKIHPLLQHGKSLWIHLFSERSKGLPKFQTITVLIVSQFMRELSSEKKFGVPGAF
jgi:hypothetical protein